MKYFITDTHFCYENVIKFSHRPFQTVEQMNQTLIKNWNRIVKYSDEVYILGDFLYRGSASEVNEIL
jgi:calcineurin-like phosphoesterase family protein